MAYNSFQNIHAHDIANKTRDAYSFHRYGETAWFKIARFLIAEGYTLEAVTEVLLSKHMRWAADHSKSSTGGYTTFRKYYLQIQGWDHPSSRSRTGKNDIDQMLKDECGLSKFLRNDEALIK